MVDVLEPQVALATAPEARPARVAEQEPQLDQIALLIQGDDRYGVGRVAREITALLPGIRCVAFCRGSEHDEIVAQGVPVHVLPGGEYFRGFAPRPGLFPAVWQLLRARPHWRRCARELAAWCERERVRVLHGNVWAHYFTLGALRRMRPGRFRTIWHVHNFLNLERHLGLRARFNRWQVRRGADWVLAVSRAVAAGWGRSGVPTRVIHNCIGSRHQALPAAAPFPPPTPERPLRLVGAGRMEYSKGHHVSIAAVARLRDAGLPVTLDLFGGPHEGNPYVDELRRQVAAAGLGGIVRLHEYVDDFVRRLGEFDVALQARIDPEPCSLYVLECMHRAVPLVASAGGGTPELVRDGREGCLYPPGDPIALAAGVARLARSPELAARLGRAARERVAREFTPERFARNLAAFYGEVLVGARATRAAAAGADAAGTPCEGLTTTS